MKSLLFWMLGTSAWEQRYNYWIVDRVKLNSMSFSDRRQPTGLNQIQNLRPADMMFIRSFWKTQEGYSWSTCCLAHFKILIDFWDLHGSIESSQVALWTLQSYDLGWLNRARNWRNFRHGCWLCCSAFKQNEKMDLEFLCVGRDLPSRSDAFQATILGSI